MKKCNFRNYSDLYANIGKFGFVNQLKIQNLRKILFIRPVNLASRKESKN